MRAPEIHVLIPGLVTIAFWGRGSAGGLTEDREMGEGCITQVGPRGPQGTGGEKLVKTEEGTALMLLGVTGNWFPCSFWKEPAPLASWF